MVLSCQKQTKDYTLLKLSFSAGRDFEHIHFPVDPMQSALSQHEDSQKFPYALGQTLQADRFTCKHKISWNHLYYKMMLQDFILHVGPVLFGFLQTHILT